MRFFVVLTLLFLSTLPSRADPNAIRDVIGSQIEAFQADDFERAFTFASPGIQAFFGNYERFGTMVQTGYPMVWRPASVEYLGLSERNGQPVQTVMFTDQNGTLHVLAYTMENGEAGWRIDGVQLVRAPQVGA